MSARVARGRAPVKPKAVQPALAFPIRVLAATPANLAGLRRRTGRDLEGALATAARIIGDVRRRGGAGLQAWRQRLEAGSSGELPPLVIAAEECRRAWKAMPADVQRGLRQAHDNIRRVAAWQMPRAWRRAIAPGVRVGQMVRALESVGCYVPGGRFPLPSTLLMTATPARTAGVGRVVAVCPQPAAVVLAAAWLAGVDELYCTGGAQAIAALAYGAGPIEPVQKIVGPGNVFVTAAKRLVWPQCEIDFLAGPTEVLCLADGKADPEFLAADLIAQAEHDPMAAAWLITLGRTQAEAVRQALARQLKAAPNPVARASLRRHGAILVARGRREAMAAANQLAAEHVTLPRGWEDRLNNAGSVFVGDFAPEAAGDYITGTNHVLPTGGGARTRGGLSALDFVKLISVQELTRSGLGGLAPAITTLARAEGLEGHARSVEIRLRGAR